jgi:hypothetical protein
MRFFSVNLKKDVIFDLIIFSIYSFTLFVFLVKFDGSDIKGHNNLLSSYLSEGYFPIPPLYYGLVYLVDIFIRVKYEFVISSIIVVSFFQWWKYRLVYASLKRRNLGFRPFTLFFLSLSFLFLSPIYIPVIDGDLWYLGKFTQTIWHSSTLICSFPFCILLVWKSLDWIKWNRRIDLWKILFLSFLIILIKPSFLFCYIPALPVFIYFQNFKITRQVGEAIAICFFLFGLLLVEKYLVFNWDPVLDVLYSESEKSRVVLNPLKVWLHFTKEPIFDFITSFPLLFAAIVIWRTKLFENRMFSFSLLLLFFAMLVFFLLAESGFREFHANFYWQIPIALFLCNLSIVYFVLEQFYLEKGTFSTKFIIMIFIYLLQTALGFGFWLRILIDLTHQ